MTPAPGRPNIFDAFIERPLLAVVISLTLVLLGLRAATDMPVLEFPEIESSSLVITTPYIGASAETVQGFVTDPIERAVSTVPGVDYIESSTTAGMSVVTAWLKLNESSTLALAELTSRLSQIRFELPAGAEDPSIDVERTDASNAIFYLDVFMGGRSIAETTDYLSRYVVPIMTSIPGVQRVSLPGGRAPAMRVWLDPVRMDYFNVSAQQVRTALASNNVIAPIGRIENQQQRINLQTSATLKTREDFEQLIVANVDNAIVRVGDIARLELGEVESDRMARRSQRDTIYLAVYGLPGANELDIGNRLYAVLDEINASLPDGMKIEICLLYTSDAADDEYNV